jgi:hypothetical protein
MKNAIFGPERQFQAADHLSVDRWDNCRAADNITNCCTPACVLRRLAVHLLQCTTCRQPILQLAIAAPAAARRHG